MQEIKLSESDVMVLRTLNIFKTMAENQINQTVKGILARMKVKMPGGMTSINLSLDEGVIRVGLTKPLRKIIVPKNVKRGR